MENAASLNVLYAMGGGGAAFFRPSVALCCEGDAAGDHRALLHSSDPHKKKRQAEGAHTARLYLLLLPLRFSFY